MRPRDQSQRVSAGHYGSPIHEPIVVEPANVTSATPESALLEAVNANLTATTGKTSADATKCWPLGHRGGYYCVTV
ncbi:hypothetical protein Gpo141_00012685 [Globisporangium polare]